MNENRKNIKKLLLAIIIAILPIFISLIIFYYDDDLNKDLWNILLVIGTIYLGLLAAFQDFVRRLFYRPELHCKLILEPPHCHKLEGINTYYIRFMILNKGNVSANNVEVFLKSVIDSKGKYRKISAGNLLWSTLNLERYDTKNPFSPYRIYWDYISPGTYQYCNLGEIKIPTDPEQNREGLTFEQRWDYKFNLSLYWKSIDNSFSLPPGKYKFEIIIAALNAKPVNMLYEINFDGKWDNREDVMFSESIKLISEEII